MRPIHCALCMLSCFCCVQLFLTQWTVAHPEPLSLGFSRQKYWTGLPCPPPGDLPNLGIKPTSLTSPALAGGLSTTSATWEAYAPRVCAKLLQLCLTLCNPMDTSPPGSSVHRILQARILEWVVISYSRGSSWPRDHTHVPWVSYIDRWVSSH